MHWMTGWMNSQQIHSQEKISEEVSPGLGSQVVLPMMYTILGSLSACASQTLLYFYFSAV